MAITGTNEILGLMNSTADVVFFKVFQKRIKTLLIMSSCSSKAEGAVLILSWYSSNNVGRRL